jgi:hypothetical protein
MPRRSVWRRVEDALQLPAGTMGRMALERVTEAAQATPVERAILRDQLLTDDDRVVMLAMYRKLAGR